MYQIEEKNASVKHIFSNNIIKQIWTKKYENGTPDEEEDE